MNYREILGDRYQVQEQLAKKGGRRTLLARDLQTSNMVVVKLLSFNSDFEWDDLKLFEREAQTLKSLSHPAIPRYLDYFEINTPIYKGFALIQTYIPAQTLEQYILTGQTFTEIEVQKIAKVMLRILGYLHQLHPPVIHRDIKPSNILLGNRSGNSRGQIHLIDFGSVQNVLSIGIGTRTVVGTYGYMPPEQFGGRTVPASDLYSLGATLIYLLTGTHPADLPQKDFRIQFEQLTTISSSFTNWLKRMVEPDLSVRFSSVNQAFIALEETQFIENTNHQIINVSIPQPVESEIKLIKNADNLQFIMPPTSFQSSRVVFNINTLLWLLFVAILCTLCVRLFSFVFPNNFTVLGFSFPFLYEVFIIINEVLSLMETKILSIDNQQIILTTKGWQFPKESIISLPRQSINKLVYTRKNISSRLGHPVPGKLEIWAEKKRSKKKIQLNAHNKISGSEEELEWLTQEISNWLQIPIIKR